MLAGLISVDIQSHWTWSSTLLQSANQAFQYVSCSAVLAASFLFSSLCAHCRAILMLVHTIRHFLHDLLYLHDLFSDHDAGCGRTVLVRWCCCGTDPVLWYHCCVHQGDNLLLTACKSISHKLHICIICAGIRCSQARRQL